MAGYVRQAAAEIQPDLAILAQSFNKEFNALSGAFQGSQGHDHSGTVGNGPRLSLQNSVTGLLPVGNGGTGSADPIEARENLGVEIGVDVQEFSVDLDSIVNIPVNDVGVLVKVISGNWVPRKIEGTTGEITVNDSTGTSANFKIGLPQKVVLGEKEVTGGTFTGGSFSGTHSGNGAGLTNLQVTGITGIDTAFNLKMDKSGGTFTGPVTFSDNVSVSNGKNISSQTAPSSNNHLANKGYVDSEGVRDRDRANHTGTQSISSVDGLQAILDSKVGSSGGQVSGTLNMNNNRITNTGTPEVSGDAVPLEFLMNWFPTGSTTPYAGNDNPNSQWLLCNGQAVSRATYARLFAIIGVRFGGGNGTSTFNVPDLRERVIAGGGGNAGRLSLSGMSGANLGQVGGAGQLVLSEAQMPSHNHYASGYTSTNGSHVHRISVPGDNWSEQSSNKISISGRDTISMHAEAFNSDAAGDHNHFYEFNTNHKGGNQPLILVQPTMIMNYIIKT